MSQGASIAIAYAVRHPERVTHLVLQGGYARGRRVRAVRGMLDFLLIFSLIVGNGVFAGAEIALLSARRLGVPARMLHDHIARSLEQVPG